MTSLAQRGGCQADPGESRPRPGQGRSACCCRRQSRAVNQISRKFSPHLKKMSFDCTFSLLRIYYRYLLTKPPQSSQWLTLRTSVAISGFYPPVLQSFLHVKALIGALNKEKGIQRPMMVFSEYCENSRNFVHSSTGQAAAAGGWGVAVTVVVKASPPPQPRSLAMSRDHRDLCDTRVTFVTAWLAGPVNRYFQEILEC